MITTKIEWNVFKRLIESLDETIDAIGGCEHEVNVCSCKERWLKKDTEEIINKHKKRGYNAIL